MASDQEESNAVNGQCNGPMTSPDLSEEKGVEDIQYKVWDTPPFHLCILLGFQHYISIFTSTLTVPFLLSPVLCIEGDNVGLSEIIGTIFVASGLITLLQSLLGVRLPIIQSCTFALMAPTIAYFSLPEWKCPAIVSADSISNYSIANTTELLNSTFVRTVIAASPEHKEIWKERLRIIQGSLMVAAPFEIILGATGLVGILLRFVGPLSICSTVALLGLSLFGSAASYGGQQWWIMSIAIMLSVVIAWTISYILTVTNVFPNDKDAWGYGARTDLKTDVIKNSPWVRIPYPGQWGMPQFSISLACGLFAGLIATIVESVGDYHACARLSGAPPPPMHAINRGIMIEGIGTFFDGLMGTGNGTTSASTNVGVVGLTKVGSRRVVQVCAIFMVVLGIFTKFGALFVTIPSPVMGGAFFILFGIIVAVGISNLQYVDLNSSRNLFIIGFSFLLGLSLPDWMKREENSEAINLGNETVNGVIRVLLSMPMFVGGSTAFIFDNTIPGTTEERGMSYWKKIREMQNQSNASEELKRTTSLSYDLPFGTEWLKKWSITRWLPICPNFGHRPITNRADGEKIIGDAEAVNFSVDTKI